MPSFSESLEKSLHVALTLANDRAQEYATLEHLLLALIDDDHASSVMKACNVDLNQLRGTLTDYIDTELSNLVTGYEEDSKTHGGFPARYSARRNSCAILRSGRSDRGPMC